MKKSSKTNLFILKIPKSNMSKLKTIAIKTTRKFKKEFKRQLRLAIGAAIGFLIAFAWKDVIFAFVQDTITDLSSLTNIHLVGLLSSLTLTLLGVILLLISSRLLE
jgi:hypothetical protein